MNVVEIMTLGFLAEGSACGYRLRKKMERLNGFARPFSDGTLHAVTGRFVKAGYIGETFEVVNGRRLRQFHLEPAGRAALVEELKNASGYMVTDITKWAIVMSFLSVIPDEADRNAVLRRRLDVLDSDVHRMYSDGVDPLDNDKLTDKYRLAITAIHDKEIAAEREWLVGELGAETE
ncbi:PadR family transcriptional regulator [Bifidobacterium avesanii]|uniref:PadR family transcriptional regulator n=1 Tax=Bifidobacterium avesanii TaxID=1798157 RepID=A0A7K3TGW7_9BIFI|nr:helix-turn-helix transcriptional regulator [Bifidobacterium avesanii]KAB8291511.1 PadR family transcriptional regulator [Bifidobacterium avesanii]NEG77860.1 PadR family transcriptional regulator [Bifidobacterium avesanii]